MAEIKATLTAIYYDDKERMTGLSYNTTIPTSLPISIANEIIYDIVESNLSHIENVNGSPKKYGKLSGVTANLTQECYCFSVTGTPRQLLQEINFDYE